jgi:hypothetical protein
VKGLKVEGIMSIWNWSSVWRWPQALMLAALISATGAGVRGQDDHKRKVPVLDKLTASSTQQMFNGTVQSVDREHSLLNVNAVKSTNVEVFALKPGIHIASPTGDRLNLDALAPGTSVLIHYQMKKNSRQVKDIVVLEGSTNKETKKSS